VADLAHEPAKKEDGSVYRPYILDDSGQIQGYTGLLCRLCHVYYADPGADVAWDKTTNLPVPWPAQLSDASVCPAKLHQLLKQTVL